MTEAARYLRAYDQQLRGEAEMGPTATVTRQGPLYLAVLERGSGFITHTDLGPLPDDEVEALVTAALAHFRDATDVDSVEWKTRGHDQTTGLVAALVRNGFGADDPESIMIGPAEPLAVDVELPDGVRVRRVTSEPDVMAMAELQGKVFDDPHWERRAQTLVQRLAAGDDLELWVAEYDGEPISAGRIDPVPGTDFAGLWGGVTRADWRGRGVYRAVTAARARAALARGMTLLQSDSTEFSRPILERSGLVKVSTTTPYVWQRPPA